MVATDEQKLWPVLRQLYNYLTRPAEPAPTAHRYMTDEEIAQQEQDEISYQLFDDIVWRYESCELVTIDELRLLLPYYQEIADAEAARDRLVYEQKVAEAVARRTPPYDGISRAEFLIRNPLTTKIPSHAQRIAKTLLAYERTCNTFRARDEAWTQDNPGKPSPYISVDDIYSAGVRRMSRVEDMIHDQAAQASRHKLRISGYGPRR